MRNTWTGQADIQSDPRHDAGIKLRDMILAGLANGLGVTVSDLDATFAKLERVKMSDDLNVIIEGYGHIISAILCLEAWLKEVDIPDRNSPHWRRSKLDRDEVVAMKEAIKAFKEKTDALLAEYEWAFKEIC